MNTLNDPNTQAVAQFRRSVAEWSTAQARQAHERGDDGMASEMQDLARQLQGPSASVESQEGPPAPSPWQDNDGHVQVPARYMASGRETVDRMRDLCRDFAAAAVAGGQVAPGLEWPPEALARLGDLFFAAAALTHGLKYHDRMGRKEGVDPARDARAEAWWTHMAGYAIGQEGSQGEPDPRVSRAQGFTPYKYAPSVAYAWHLERLRSCSPTPFAAPRASDDLGAAAADILALAGAVQSGSSLRAVLVQILGAYARVPASYREALQRLVWALEGQGPATGDPIP